MQHKAVIVGAGAAGMALQHRLCRYFNAHDSVAVVDPAETHYYQPLWTLVGGGKKRLSESAKPMAELMHSKVNWHQTTVEKFSPDSNEIQLANGRKLGYENLIVATGLKVDFAKVKGLEEALKGPVENGVCSNYSEKTVEKTRECIENIAEKAKSGEKCSAIFTMPPMPIKCAGAPQKIMYLAHEYWRKQNCLENIEITFCTATPGIFGQPDYAAALREVCVEKGLNLEYENNLLEINGNEATFTKNTKKFDMIHVTPPQRALDVCAESPLADAATGWIDVCPKTLQSTKFENVWALGDCSSAPTSKTAAAVAGQNRVLFENLIAKIEGEELPVEIYDGYASCPLTVGEDKCILAEFDYKMRRKETMGAIMDQRKPSKFNYLLKANAMPSLYWNLHCKGHWDGPKSVRSMFDLIGAWKNNHKNI